METSVPLIHVYKRWEVDWKSGSTGSRKLIETGLVICL